MTSTATGQKAKCREALERNFTIEALVTQFLGEDILVQHEYYEIQSTPNHMDKNRKVIDYLIRKNDGALEGTLSILEQPQYRSYHYLGNILKNVLCCQRSSHF